MRFRLRDVFIVLTIFCIATAAMAALPHRHFILPVGVTTMCFLLIGQRKVALAFSCPFLVAWLLVSVAQLVAA
jgi:hypothetical protein